jgi:hypothetical protein
MSIDKLAGLPYSAGFLGKEFLLFQVLRDDFLALWVRGCWLVSFFFTPIYMFMLVYLAMFGVKKGSIVAYRSVWNFSFSDQIISLLSAKKQQLQSVTPFFYVYRLLFTSITSRSTSYFLFFFWVFFFFFGESLLLLTFNYSSIVDTIMSSAFFNVKSHTILMIDSLSSKLSHHIECFIFFLTTSAIFYLLSSNYTCNYFYFQNSFISSTTAYVIIIILLIL